MVRRIHRGGGAAPDGEPSAIAAMLEGHAELGAAWERDRPGRELSHALLRLRRASGLSQKELAAAAGWDAGFVSRTEAGTGTVPTLETVARYVAACGGTAKLTIGDGSGIGEDRLDLAGFAGGVARADSPEAERRRSVQDAVDGERYERRTRRTLAELPGLPILLDEPDRKRGRGKGEGGKGSEETAS